MPIYEYECRKCKAHLEVFQKFTDRPPVKCQKCGGRLDKLISAPAIQFKGSGWYITDYAGKARQASEKAESDSSSDGSGADKKTDKQSEKKTKQSSPSSKTSDKSSSRKLSGGD